MRLLVVTSQFPIHGEPTRGRPVYQTVRELSRLADVHVVSPVAGYPRWARPRSYTYREVVGGAGDAPGCSVEYTRYPVLPLVSRPLNGWACGRTLDAALRRFRPDVVLGYWLYPDAVGAMQAARRAGVAFLAGARGSDLRVRDAVTRRMTRPVVRAARRLLVVSQDLGDVAVARYGALRERVRVVPNGCDAAIFHARDRAQARARLGLADSARLVLYVGRLVPEKGLRELFAASGGVAAKHPGLELALRGQPLVDGRARLLGELGVSTSIDDGSLVLLAIDDDLTLAANAQAGVAAFTNVQLAPDGEYTLMATCQGEESIDSAPLSVVVDTVPPTIDADVPLVGVEQPHQQVSHSRLAGAGGSDERHRPPWLHGERDLLDPPPFRFLAGVVVEVGVGEIRGGRLGIEIPHLRSGGGGSSVTVEAAVPVGNAVLGLEHRVDAFEADDRPGQLTEQPSEHTHRERDEPEQERERDQVTGRQDSLVHSPGTHEQDRQDGQVRQPLDERVEDRPEPSHIHHPVPQQVGALAEAAHLSVLPAQSLHHQSRVEGLVGDLRHLRSQPLGSRRHRPHASLVQQVGDGDDRHGGEADQGQIWVREQHHNHGDHHHQGDAERHRQRVGDEGGRLHVGVDVGEQLAGGMTPVPLDREGEVPVGDLGPISGLQPVQGGIGAEAATGDADAAHCRHSEDGQGRTHQE